MGKGDGRYHALSQARKGVQGVPMVYVVHNSPESDTHLNLDEEIIARVCIVDARSTLKMAQHGLHNYVDWQCDAFNIDNTLVYHNILKIFMDMDAFVYLKQRTSTQHG